MTSPLDLTSTPTRTTAAARVRSALAVTWVDFSRANRRLFELRTDLRNDDVF